MNRSQFTRTKTIQKVGIVLSVVPLLLIFQNCGGFNTAVSTEFASMLQNPLGQIGPTQTNVSLSKLGITCENPGAIAPTPISRMSKIQIQNTITSAFGSDVYNQVKETVAQLPNDILSNDPSQFENQFQEVQLDIIDAVAKKIAIYIGDNDTRLTAFAGTCAKEATVSSECLTNFLKFTGKRIHRRPLAEIDLKEYRDIYTAGGSNRAGLKAVIKAFVLAPEFLYHLEVGEGTTAAMQFALTSHELANRISYLLSDSPPDEELTKTADSGDIFKADVLGNQVERILKTGNGKAKLKRFFSYWLQSDKFSGLPSGKNNLAGLDPNGLVDELRNEMNTFIDHIVYEKRGSYADLMTSRRSFARTTSSASIYGQQGLYTDGAMTMADEHHLGILSRTPVLGSSTLDTHPIVRGAMIRRRVLCDPLPPPSVEDLQGREKVTFVVDRVKYSTRDNTHGKTSQTSCQTCHARINPAGFVFEQFDNFGRYRTLEKVFDETDMKIAEHDIRIDETIRAPSGEMIYAKNASEFMTQLAGTVQGPACMSREIFRFYNVRPDAKVDGCQITAIYEGMKKSNGSLIDAIKSVLVGQYSGQRRIQ